MRIIFSRDRAAQLDLLLNSISRNMAPEGTTVIWNATSRAFVDGYRCLDLPEMQPPDRFEHELRRVLGECDDETVTFFCDDDVVYRPVQGDPASLLLSDDRILTVSLFLGRGNAKQKIPRGFPVWEWGPLARHDFGFPCALDGNTYRTADVIRMIGGDEISSPTFLETVLSMRLRAVAEDRPLAASFQDQSVVGVNVNRVSEASGVPYGKKYPQDTAALNARFLAGQRIALEALNFDGVNSCHHEIDFVWE